ncbi:MAG: hypothetical protein J6A59_01680 [Lachnospiraceae bacterium]|nr:hypothetical protein [Lachnospiraceae bacterium]
MSTCGVVLFRAQPLHKAHMWLIEKALEENDRVCLVLGSSNKHEMLRNPFTFRLRKDMIIGALKNEMDIDRIILFELPDWSQESIEGDNKIWGHYLYYNIVSRIGQKHFSIYYSDEPEIIEQWFDDEVREYVGLRTFERQAVFDGLSATKIRNSLLNYSDDDKKYLEQMLPDNVFKMTPMLRKLWKYVLENPLSDFSME